MKKYLNPSEWKQQIKNGIPLDKRAHLLGGFVIHSVFLYLLSPLSALVPVIIAAVGKEYYDSNTHPADWKDALATVLGGIASLGIYYILGG